MTRHHQEKQAHFDPKLLPLTTISREHSIPYPAMFPLPPMKSLCVGCIRRLVSLLVLIFVMKILRVGFHGDISLFRFLVAFHRQVLHVVARVRFSTSGGGSARCGSFHFLLARE